MQKEITSRKNNITQATWLTLLRIIVGIILIIKGIVFIRDISSLQSLIKETNIGIFTQNEVAFALVVTMLNLLGGIFITVGLFTRIACIFQLPIVLVAFLFINIKQIDRNGLELILTIVVIILLILFAIKGSGPFSADEYFRMGAAADRDSKIYNQKKSQS